MGPAIQEAIMWFMIHPIRNMPQGLFFVDQSKTASTTTGEVFWHAIMMSKGHIGGVHKTARFLKFNYGRYWEPYHTFSTIRNPYDRFVSAYFFKSDDWHNDEGMIEREISKEAILELMENVTAYPVRRQVHYVTDENGDVMVDQLILYPNLKRDIAKLAEDFHVPLVNVDDYDECRLQTTRGKGDWRNFYDMYPDLWDIVTDIYQDDISLYLRLGGEIDR